LNGKGGRQKIEIEEEEEEEEEDRRKYKAEMVRGGVVRTGAGKGGLLESPAAFASYGTAVLHRPLCSLTH
jgi:hypothetical protein